MFSCKVRTSRYEFLFRNIPPTIVESGYNIQVKSLSKMELKPDVGRWRQGPRLHVFIFSISHVEWSYLSLPYGYIQYSYRSMVIVKSINLKCSPRNPRNYKSKLTTLQYIIRLNNTLCVRDILYYMITDQTLINVLSN